LNLSIESAPESRPSPQADLWSALVWIVLGGAIAVASWRMDRLTHMGATLYTAPGLVPGILGAAIALLGLALGLRALRERANAESESEAIPARVWLVLLLCLAYAAGLVGRGIPFWLATFLFVAVFVAIFEYPSRQTRGQLGRGLAMACLYGAATSAIVSVVFEQVFLVRLP
jgi:Ca2+/Na+ antiporter